jgi:hypothetical protein
VRVAEMNARKLPMTCRNKPLGDVESASGKQRVTSPAGIWFLAGWHPAYRQHDRSTGFRTERGNLSSRCQGSGAEQWHCKRLSTDAGHRGRWPRSSDEAPVMGVERRGPVVGAELLANQAIGRSL